MNKTIFQYIAAAFAIALAQSFAGCSHPNVIMNGLPKDTSVSRLVAGKSVVLLVQPNAAPIVDDNGNYSYGDEPQGGSAAASTAAQPPKWNAARKR